MPVIRKVINNYNTLEYYKAMEGKDFCVLCLVVSQEYFLNEQKYTHDVKNKTGIFSVV